MARLDSQVGYDFEDEVKKQFVAIKSNTRFDFHKYVDTKAAARFVGPQPADFQIAFIDVFSKAQVIIVECKASLEKESLRECASSHIKPQQIGKHKSWLRAGGQGMFWFYCEATGLVEFWDSAYVLQQRTAGKPLDKRFMRGSGEYVTLKDDILRVLDIKYIATK